MVSGGVNAPHKKGLLPGFSAPVPLPRMITFKSSLDPFVPTSPINMKIMTRHHAQFPPSSSPPWQKSSPGYSRVPQAKVNPDLSLDLPPFNVYLLQEYELKLGNCKRTL